MAAGILLVGVAVGLVTVFAASSPISLTTFGAAYAENFDTLASAGTSSVVPNGWDFAESGTNANTTYTAGTGSGNTGDTYSFGATGNSERAFGGLRSGSLVPLFGAQFTNNTGGTITSLAVSYTGEQWRLGQNTAGRAADRLDFQLSTNAASLMTGTWTDYDALDFNSPVVAGTVGALNGNVSPNRTALSFTIIGLSIPNGGTFWIRWADSDLTPGADDGLSVDDFSLTPDGVVVADVAPEVFSTVPANGAVDVARNATLTINFSEPVNVTGTWFTISCATSGSHTAAVNGGPTSFALDPDTDFAYGEQCTLTVYAANVTDQDSNDPPDNMLVNFTAGFTTEFDQCALAFTPIYEIQGSGPTPAITGPVTTQGVVVGDYEYPGSGLTSASLRGFFIQDLAGDGNAATSDGIFVFNGNNNSVSLGDVVRVAGTAGDFQDQTQLSSVTSIVKCGTGSVAPTDVTFPVPSPTHLEQYEGMLVRLPQTMYVTENFQLGRFGQVVLSSGGRLMQPTSVVAPGPPALALEAQNDLRRIILDDASQAQNPDPILFGRGGQPLSASNTLRSGDTATGIVGVLNYTWAGNVASGNAYRIRPVNALNGYANFEPSNPRPAAAPDVGGTVRVVSMNPLNYFNTFADNSAATPGCFPSGTDADCRGANSATEFVRQYTKTVAAIVAMNPDVLAINEIENDGYGPPSAMQSLTDQLNAATAPGTYAFIDADANTGQVNAMGVDAIKIGVLYKAASVTPVGQTAVLNSPAFVNGGDSAPRNRPSIAQAFQVNATGAVFVVDANHLKSKGAACDAPDTGDGQGNCNQVRVNAVTELLNWLASDPTGTADPDILIVGDLNTYAMEDPITTLKGAGFGNLVEAFVGPDAYSYVFDGQWGYLDHALGSASLASQVSGVGHYHVSADEPSVLDYNVEFKSAGQVASLYAANEFRISDHDPVVIGLTPNGGPTVDAGGPYTVDEGGSVTLTAAGSDPNGDALIYDWDLDNDGTFETPGQSVAFSAASLDGPSAWTVKVKATDPGGLSAVSAAMVDVVNVPPAVSTPTVTPEPSIEGGATTAGATFIDPAGSLDAPYTCTVDYGDGSGPQAGLVAGGACTGPAHAYATFGSYVVIVTVTDKDGGTGSASATHNVIFGWTGFFPPISNATWNVAKAGSAVPVKFSLNGYKGMDIFAAGYPKAVPISCDTGSPLGSGQSTATAGGSSLSYDPLAEQYVYVWKTERSWAGTCWRLDVTLVDGTSHVATFRFK